MDICPCEPKEIWAPPGAGHFIFGRRLSAGHADLRTWVFVGLLRLWRVRLRAETLLDGQLCGPNVSRVAYIAGRLRIGRALLRADHRLDTPFCGPSTAWTRDFLRAAEGLGLWKLRADATSGFQRCGSSAPRTAALADRRPVWIKTRVGREGLGRQGMRASFALDMPHCGPRGSLEKGFAGRAWFGRHYLRTLRAWGGPCCGPRGVSWRGALWTKRRLDKGCCGSYFLRSGHPCGPAKC